jgi:hypothetical protein
MLLRVATFVPVLDEFLFSSTVLVRICQDLLETGKRFAVASPKWQFEVHIGITFTRKINAD